MPLVSAVIPAHNAGRFLRQAVDSALSQTQGDLEVVVVDNDSTDDTSAIMAGYGPPVRYVRQDDRGPAGSRNRGLAESQGRWVAFLDADDVWLPEKLDRQLEALSRSPRALASYTAYRIIDADARPGEMRRQGPQEHLLETLVTRGNVVGIPSTVLVERTLALSVGGFDPELGYGADWDLWIRLALRTEFAYVDEPLTLYRQHSANMSARIDLLEADSVRLLHKAFDYPGLPSDLRRRRRQALAWNALVLSGSYWRAGQGLAAVRCGLRGVMLDPSLVRRPLGFLARALARRLARRD